MKMFLRMNQLGRMAPLLACLILGGCLRNLEEEGIGTSVQVSGTAVEAFTGLPAQGVRVLVTNGERQSEEAVTASDGKFKVSVTYEQLHEGYWLGLTADSLYRATTYLLDGIGYGLKEYDMQVLHIEGPEPPQIVTDVVTGISQTSAIGGGTVMDDGRSAIRRRGICWSTAPNPTIVNDYADAGNGVGHFNIALTGLQQGVTYHVRAFATNVKGIAYGQEEVFTTISTIPVVTTTAITEVTRNSITCGGNVTSDNGQPVTARGICYSSTSTEPTINDAHTSNGTGTGSFVTQITGLQSAMTYYIRAYATNASGTGYGEVKTVTTF